jgi:rod shape-determining protein MreC
LVEENAKLHSMLKSSMVEVGISMKSHSDTNAFKIVQKYNFTDAEIINNSYRHRNNHITINKGLKNGINNGDGVITSNGVIGVIENTGENYSSVISILNKNLQVNAKLKKSNYFGSLSWPGKDRSRFILSDIPKEAKFSIGDTIITGGYSTIFPEGINIGVIEKFNIIKDQNYYHITVRPFIDYADIKSVYIIQNLHRDEIKATENKNTN